MDQLIVAKTESDIVFPSVEIPINISQNFTYILSSSMSILYLTLSI